MIQFDYSDIEKHVLPLEIPAGLDLERDSNLVIQRTLEYGTWDEVRWLFGIYGRRKITSSVRQYGERGLTPVTFNYWRMLLGIRKWRKSPFSNTRSEV